VPIALAPGSDFRAEGLLAALGDVAGQAILIPASERARDLLPDTLRSRGAQVDLVTAYRTLAPSGLAERLAEELHQGLDLATFASPSAVEGFVTAAGPLARSLPAAVIGPVTEQAARAAGLDVRAVAAPSTAEGLVAAVLRLLAPQPAGVATAAPRAPTS
jgi:uroporphyrinogen III methyltransferase/synthase